MELALFPELKQKLINHLKLHNFKNGNTYLLQYLENLKHKYDNDNNDDLNMLNMFVNKMYEVHNLLNNNKNHNNYDESHLIESEFESLLCTISNIGLLKDLLYFFEPIPVNNSMFMDDINKKLNEITETINRLQDKVAGLEEMFERADDRLDAVIRECSHSAFLLDRLH